MALSFLYLAFVRMLQLLRLFRRDNEGLAIEVVILRHEVAVLRRQVDRPALRPSDRALLAGLSRLLGRRHLGRFFVPPETLLRWHQDLVRRRWTYPRRPGRPSVPAGTVQIILRLAGEPDLGLSQDPRRAGHDGHRTRSIECLGHPSSPRHRPITGENRPDLDRIPP
jgi:putative transposase